MAAILPSIKRRSPEACFQVQDSVLTGCVVLQGQVVPGGAEAVLFVAGHDAVRQGLLDVEVRGVTALGDGLAEGDLVEGVGRGGFESPGIPFPASRPGGSPGIPGGPVGRGRPAGRSSGTGFLRDRRNWAKGMLLFSVGHTLMTFMASSPK